MKKKLAFALLLGSIAVVSLGCTSSGSSTSWCRSGSVWPWSRTATKQVYTDYGGSSCNPCNPCEPVCDPCVPVCDPCGGIPVTTVPSAQGY